MSAAAEAIANYWETHATEATEKKQLFLEAMQECGIVLESCVRAGINRTTAYRFRWADNEFRNAWDSAKADADDRIRHSLYNQAKSEKNVVATIFYLKHNCPEYKEGLPLDLSSVDRQIEDWLSQLQPQGAQGIATSSPSHSTKEIIAEVLNTKRQLPAPISPDDTIT
jgi:hypothetical protein